MSQQRTLSRTQTLPLKVTKSVPAPSARKPKRGAGSSTAQSAETVRSEPSPPLPDLCLRSPALFQNCGRIIERFTGHDKNALSKALLRIADRLSTHMDDRVQLALKMDQDTPRTSVPEACLTAPRVSKQDSHRFCQKTDHFHCIRSFTDSPTIMLGCDKFSHFRLSPG